MQGICSPLAGQGESLGVRDELGVFPTAEVFEIGEVIHKRLILKVFALGEV